MTSAGEPAAHALLTIDLAALGENWRRLRARLPTGCVCAASVKADAYGLGTAPVVEALSAAGCRAFFVFTPEEGAAVRAALAGRAGEIFVLLGPLAGSEAMFEAAGLVPVLNSLDQVARWQPHARPAALMVDTGMARLGLSPAEVATLEAEPDRLAGIELRLVMSHLACAEQPDHPQNQAQRDAFLAARTRLPAAPASLANSAAIFLGPGWCFDLVRPGAALYGLAPVAAAPNPMLPVVSLSAAILQVRDVDTGGTVGYGATHRARRQSRIATVGVGYGDGFFRYLSNRGFGFIGDARVPLVGRVSMDLVTFDVTDVASDAAHPGAMVELIGPHADVDEIAAAAGTIGYEVLTALGRRYRRVYLGGA